ncbi:Type II secretion system protein F [Dickeya dianthicola]|uniref:type II secretion system F family protein n=1 Tax=Dickeya dianthicola TaxID=204039 RepID=UPI0003A7EFE6|nr:type II secretion system F family protein [Dickeya dianthicola]AYC20040.1 Type II secretion system protein F [Dickeya dianthicola]MCI4001957.1 type II secretion system F family protein [Dickeya dianthicola]MCI4030039.1 type II secretion system F family protein [Dickeya dianthicola]MCI4067735.1 type II secretion system F family protein [Dickeya dianthicola]MCI4115507.1 type II secretion system F family protein [Dickeya dianthicola]
MTIRNFRYIAVNTEGELVTGRHRAFSKESLREQLFARQLIMVSCRVSLLQQWLLLLSRHERLSTLDLALLTRQLASLLEAGIPLEEALTTLASQADKHAVGAVLNAVREQLIAGLSFAQALQTLPYNFNRLYCAMVAAGEATGCLALVLIRLADYLDQHQKTKNALIQALLYPVLLAVMSVIVVSILLSSVVPQVVMQLQQTHTPLPLTTRTLLAISDVLNHYGWMLPVALAALAVGLHQIVRIPARKLWLDRHLLRLYAVGPLLRDISSARYIRTMEILIASAIPLLESMSVAENVLNNSFARFQLTVASQKVNEGKSLTESLSNNDIFSGMVKHMIASGERSGRLEPMLKYIADIQEESLKRRISLLLLLGENGLLIIISSLVLFIVMSILQPIMQLSNTI